MRFDDPDHLEAWRCIGAFPAIHTAMANMVACCIKGERVLDLGCSYGLLAKRLVRQLGVTVIGVDASAKVAEASAAAGLGIPIHVMRIRPDNLMDLADLVIANRIEVIVARRVLPELFGADLDAGAKFAAIMRGAGVKEMFVEGRVVSERSTNALASIEDEVALLSRSYLEVRRVGAVSYLNAFV